MARPLRLEYHGALYHVTSRGDGQEEIYLDDEDREVSFSVLDEVVKAIQLDDSRLLSDE